MIQQHKRERGLATFHQTIFIFIFYYHIETYDTIALLQGCVNNKLRHTTHDHVRSQPHRLLNSDGIHESCMTTRLHSFFVRLH